MGIKDLHKKLQEAKANQIFNCRFHPTDGWHEVGCPHLEWTQEQLHEALMSERAMVRVYQHELFGMPLDGRPRSSYTDTSPPTENGEKHPDK